MILRKISQIFENVEKNFKKFDRFLEILDNFLQNVEFRAVQKCVNLVDLVDLEKC